MKKIITGLSASILYLVFAAPVKAAEFFGYPIVPKQARFYLILLCMIAFSMALVGGAYAIFWILDLKKKSIKLSQPALSRNPQAYAGKLVPVAQPAK